MLIHAVWNSAYCRVCPMPPFPSYLKKGMLPHLQGTIKLKAVSMLFARMPRMQGCLARVERPFCRHISATLLTLQCLLLLVHFLGKTLSIFALLHSAFQGQIGLLLQVFLDFLLLLSSPLEWKGYLFLGVSSKSSCRSSQYRSTSAPEFYWLGHRLGLRWYWMVCLRNEKGSFCRFWDCIQVVHFGLFCWPWWLLHFFWGLPACSSRHNGHLS